MKCPKCNNDLFRGQFICDRCGAIVTEVTRSEVKKEEVKEKKNGK